MKSSDNLASRPFTFHRQNDSVVDLSFLWDIGRGGQYIMVYPTKKEMHHYDFPIKVSF